MFTGHFGVALAGAGASRRLSFGTLIIAAFGADILEGVVAAFHVRDMTRVYSHSVPATVCIGVVCAAWVLARGGAWRDAAVIVLVAASHTALDFVTAVKTVWPGVVPMGLNLYTHPYIDALVEVGLCIAGWTVWRASLGEARRSLAAWAMMVVLVCAQGAALVHLTLTDPMAEDDALSKFVR